MFPQGNGAEVRVVLEKLVNAGGDLHRVPLLAGEKALQLLLEAGLHLAQQVVDVGVVGVERAPVDARLGAELLDGDALDGLLPQQVQKGPADEELGDPGAVVVGGMPHGAPPFPVNSRISLEKSIMHAARKINMVSDIICSKILSKTVMEAPCSLHIWGVSYKRGKKSHWKNTFPLHFLIFHPYFTPYFLSPKAPASLRAPSLFSLEREKQRTFIWQRSY